MTPRASRVERPLRKSEFSLVFGSRSAEKGWRDLVATQRSAAVDAWEFLTTRPHDVSPTNAPMRAELGVVARDEKTFERWQHKLSNGARIWFYIDGASVVLEQVHTRHPNETK